MHAVSSYRGNRPTYKQTRRQDRLQYTAPLSLARSVKKYYYYYYCCCCCYILYTIYAVVADAESRPCLQMSDIAWLEHAIGDTKTGGIRILPNAPATLENITNWDMQSTIFLALQVMGSVGKSTAGIVA